MEFELNQLINQSVNQLEFSNSGLNDGSVTQSTTVRLQSLYSEQLKYETMEMTETMTMEDISHKDSRIQQIFSNTNNNTYYSQY